MLNHRLMETLSVTLICEWQMGFKVPTLSLQEYFESEDWITLGIMTAD
jgi:hypothetical protein